jgi:hypothetical protein
LLLLPDISSWQPSADLRAVKALNGGAIILRAAYGTVPDPCFARYRAQAAGLGYSFTGLYQYLRAGQDLLTQSRAFCGIVRELAAHEVAP